MTRKHIGTPCPECGADMLTEADYKVGARIQFLMSVLQFFGLARRARRHDSDVLVRTHYHNGQTTITEIRGGEEVR